MEPPDTPKKTEPTTLGAAPKEDNNHMFIRNLHQIGCYAAHTHEYQESDPICLAWIRRERRRLAGPAVTRMSFGSWHELCCAFGQTSQSPRKKTRGSVVRAHNKR